MEQFLTNTKNISYKNHIFIREIILGQWSKSNKAIMFYLVINGSL